MKRDEMVKYLESIGFKQEVPRESFYRKLLANETNLVVRFYYGNNVELVLEYPSLGKETLLLKGHITIDLLKLILNNYNGIF